MNHEVTRQILWNVPLAFRIFLYGMLVPLTAAFVYEGIRWCRIVSPSSTTRSPRRPDFSVFPITW
jgi:hypothetical protein